jgi:hypothetical protein
MEPNVGGMDRRARLVIGVLLMALAGVGYAGAVGLAVGPLPQALTAVGIGLIGLVLLVTGAVQRCPINTVLGIDTCDT